MSSVNKKTKETIICDNQGRMISKSALNCKLSVLMLFAGLSRKSCAEIPPLPPITWQLCAQKFLMICCSFNWLSGIRFYQECKKLKCWLLTYWDHICIISFGIIDCCKHENNRPNIGAVSNVWLRRSEETYKTWYPIILRQTCSSLARQCKIGG